MAYYNASIADIINALAAADEASPQRYSRFPSRQAYAPYACQPGAFTAAQLDDDDDDESSDGGYYSLRYPDYYSPYFSQQQYRPRGQYRRQYVPVQATQPQQQQGLDLNDILNYLVGRATEEQAAPQSDSPQQSQSQQPQQPQQPQQETRNAATAQKVLEKVATRPESSEKPASSTDATSKTETKPEPVVKPTAQALHRHSTTNFKEPKPKIEISQRNAKNPTLPYSPQTNVYETDKEYTIVLALPGATLSKLDIDFHPSTNEVVIKGDIPEPLPSLPGTKINEIRTGSVERRVKFPTLPPVVDDQIKAKYQNGLLTIRIPKNDEKEVKPKRKVTIEDVPDEELLYEEHGGVIQ
ncbi:CYFA0S13e01398g1_1 [Cyberlindnera fabianii]|uniref:CYFA0S13e01398g1_1 n=1 Tax=Cyberlindnera fabianii TaxID=36022 RepID=A0A061BAS8_CYBFA|nr:CYFA0S13e01398g1_1 [Cyberlindnera fabianii]